MNYLFVTLEGGGNLPQVLGLAKRLKYRGHSVSVLSEPCMEKVVSEMGLRFIRFKKYFTRTDRKEDLMRDHTETPFSNPIFENVVFGPAKIVVDETIHALKYSDADVLVADILLLPALIAAEYLNIPRTITFHMPEYLPGPNRPPGNVGLLPGKGPFVRFRDRMFGKLFNFVFNRYKDQLNEIRKSLGMAPLNNVTDLIHAADLRLIHALPEFDFPILPAPPNVRYTGPYMDSPDWAPEEWDHQWSANDMRPLVAVAFSSTFQAQKQAIQNAIDAMRGQEVRGLVTLGMAMQDEVFDIPENVHVVSAAPHDLVFSQADLLITHAGHGTTMRALKHGVPMICLPMGRDQNDNAAKVRYHGCGLRLSKKAESQKIRKAIAQVLNDPSFRKNTIRFQEILKKNEYENVAVEALEDVIGGQSIKQTA